MIHGHPVALRVVERSGDRIVSSTPFASVAQDAASILDTVPEMVELGAGTFLADGIYIGGPLLHRGTVTLAPSRIGSRVFLGNHVVIP